MNWKTKALIQNLVARLPSRTSYSVYYWLQRTVGGLRTCTPESRLEAAVALWKNLTEAGYDPVGRRFFEVGTGWVPILPTALWLMGAKQTVTTDVNPYLKNELVQDLVRHFREHSDSVEALFGDLLDRDRWDQIIRWGKGGDRTNDSFLRLCNIDYSAPGDAAATAVKRDSIDFHFSYAVLEHIAPETLRRILQEGNRVIAPGGAFAHWIDYSDHFSHSDPGITAINFLQYPDDRWHSYAGNRYMYMNRLRHDDFQALFREVGHEIILEKPTVDLRSAELLRQNRFPLDARFADKPRKVLEVSSSWFVLALPRNRKA